MDTCGHDAKYAVGPGCIDCDTEADQVRKAMNVKRQREQTRRETLIGAFVATVGLIMLGLGLGWFATWDGVNNGDSWMPLLTFLALPGGAWLALGGINRVMRAA